MCETCKIEDVLYKNNITVYDKDNNEIELKLELMVCPMCKKINNCVWQILSYKTN